MQSQNPVVYAGVDVAKATLQLHLQGQQSEFRNTPKGLLQLVAQLQTVPSVQVVCEATGGYERAMVKVLHQAQIPVSVTNPARVRAAAQAQGQRAKTDRIDARGLTRYGHPRATGGPGPMVEAINTRAGFGQNPSRASSGSLCPPAACQAHDPS